MTKSPWKKKDEAKYAFDTYMTLSKKDGSPSECLRKDHFGFVLLRDSLRLNQSIPKSRADILLRESLRELSIGEKFDFDTLTKIVADRSSSWMGMRKSDYLVRTGMTIRPEKDLTINNIAILSKAPPEAGLIDLKDVCKNMTREQQLKLFTYKDMFAVCKAREPSEAVHNSFEVLSILRSAWNLSYNQDKRLVDYDDGKAINSILAQPIYTVHGMDGSSTGGAYWHNIHIHESQQTPLTSKWMATKHVLEQRDAFIGAVFASGDTSLSDRGMNTLFKKCLVSYGNALDERWAERRLIKLWTVLELINGAEKKGNLDRAIKRVSGLWAEPKLHSKMLYIIYSARNQLVHEGHLTYGVNDLAWLLKMYVEKSLMFMFGILGRFAHVEDYLSFLDILSSGKGVAEKKVELFKESIELDRFDF